MRVTTLFTYAVVGSRDFTNYDVVKGYLDKYNVRRIVSGGARGADKLAERYAEEVKGCQIIVLPANWDKYGKSAGYRRNEQIIESADAVIAFWDGKSKGTKHTLDLAKRRGLPIRIVKLDGTLY